MVTPLRQRMSVDMRIRNLAVTTQKAYIDQVAKFAKYFGKSPALLRPEEVRTYQVYLINEKKLGWSAFNGAVCALRFLYQNTLHIDWAFEKIPYAKKPRKRPTILSLDEVCSFLGAIPNLKHRVAAMTSYATGLRASEVLHLRPCDIDSKRMMIRVNQGKWRTDRDVPISASPSLQRFLLGCELIGRSFVLPTTCSQEETRPDLLQEKPSAQPSAAHDNIPESPRPSPCECYGTVLPLICWNPEPTYASSKPYWGIAV